MKDESEELIPDSSFSVVEGIGECKVSSQRVA
jgi:hypothetical protein